MKLKKRGDTLVEVLFAFAILSLVISVMFSGALSSYKSAVTAQERTQAQFLAQYQADALKTYRDSLEWEYINSSNFYTYLDGDKSGNASPTLVATRELKGFCMSQFKGNLTYYWKVETSTTTCGDNAKILAPNLKDASMKIDTSLVGDSQTATITVSWQPKNSSAREKVINTILLTKQR